MRDRKHVALTVALVMLLLALPVAACDGSPKASLWNTLLAPFHAIVQFLNGVTGDPHEATTDDAEIFPYIPTGG